MEAVTTKQAGSKIYHWPKQGDWSYKDYLHLPEDEWRYEIIGGNLSMSPAPSTRHQEIILELAARIRELVKEKQLGKIYIAPVDVVIADLAQPVQPDILFVPATKLDMVKEHYIEGVPELIIEVLSPGNPRHDRYTKYQLYAEAGVKEYWIVDPESCTADVYALRGQAYVPFGHFNSDSMIQSELLPELQIPLLEICNE
jgi:Uma2 family endonuclease